MKNDEKYKCAILREREREQHPDEMIIGGE